MKQRHLILSVSIAAALAAAPAALLAQPASIGTNTAVTQVTQPVNNNQLFTIPKSHFGFVGHASATTPLAGTTRMNHLQLILSPGPLRRAQMEQFITNLHNPKSAQFHHWLSPQEFGAAYGASDSDIAAVTSWLTSQGFTVNNVYPNKTQIDFTGTVAQVNSAFHTQENIYTLKSGKHVANATDIAIPSALKTAVVGVMGLSDFRPTRLIEKSEVAKWNPSKKGFVSKTQHPTVPKGISQAINFGPTTRGLAPNDMATIYGIKTLRGNGVTGQGINIAVVEDGDMQTSDWDNFVSTFNLGQYGGSIQQFNPPAPTGPNNCNDPSVNFFGESIETVLDAEWSTAIAPGANIWVATCSGYSVVNGYPSYPATTDNFFGGVYLAADNLINAADPASRPNIISASYGYGEYFTDSASKTAIDLMWAQADAEGISVFVSTGDSGSNPSFNGRIINGYYGNTAVDANSFATSPHVTGVGGNDFADVLEGTTSQYFAPTPSVVGGSALSYVPEIPWNQSCANGLAAQAMGFSTPMAFCQEYLKYDPNGYYATSEAGSGGPSSVDAKPAWQRQVNGAAPDGSRDLPDVSLFAGSYGGHTWVILCTSYYACTPDFSGPTVLEGGTSLSSPMFAGIQALIDQGLTRNGLTPNQGNAAPTLYALAAQEYGGASGPAPASLATCSANNGATGTSNCVFHNVTSGNISTQCYQESTPSFSFSTPNCYFYGTVANGQVQLGLTSSDSSPTSYNATSKAFSAQPGWSFASGLGSVNATNLLIAWRKFIYAPPIVPPTVAVK